MIRLHVIPKDGLRRRFYYRNGSQKIDLELAQDGFAKDKFIGIDPSSGSLYFTLENRTGGKHPISVIVRGLRGNYQVKVNGAHLQKLGLVAEGNEISLPVSATGATSVTLSKLP